MWWILLGDILSQCGASKETGSHLSELLKPQCTWLLIATVDIKPAGPKRECAQGQVLPMVGTALLQVGLLLTWAVPHLPGNSRIDLLNSDSLFSCATLEKPARGWFPAFLAQESRLTRNVPSFWIRKSQLLQTQTWGTIWFISIVGLLWGTAETEIKSTRSTYIMLARYLFITFI